MLACTQCQGPGWIHALGMITSHTPDQAPRARQGREPRQPLHHGQAEVDRAQAGKASTVAALGQPEGG